MHFDVKEAVRRVAPAPIHSLAITTFNTRQYRRRQGGAYWQWRDYYRRWEFVDEDAWREEQKRRFRTFMHYVTTKSPYYKEALAGLPVDTIADIADLPMLTKDDLRANLESITTMRPGEAVPAYTGGTTGASLKVYYLPADGQERHALLDHFRASFGYELGMRTAWFSGKHMLNDRDLRAQRLYRDDYRNKIRFFSTYHINDQTFDANWKALNAFRPEFIVGFPSSLYNLCYPAYERGLHLDTPITTFFPTAETLVSEHIDVIQSVLGGRTVNQYASSEGAPFILECQAGGLHIHPLTGIFEVLDADGRPAREGELVVTAFATRGTPLIRYRVGDALRLSAPDRLCSCGSTFPLVDEILGRDSDFVYSPYTGRCNQGNLTNCTKYVKGISRFQVIQDEVDAIDILVRADDSFDAQQSARFVEALRARLGPKMKITIHLVDEIPQEKSGKYRLVKNSLMKRGLV